MIRTKMMAVLAFPAVIYGDWAFVLDTSGKMDMIYHIFP